MAIERLNMAEVPPGSQEVGSPTPDIDSQDSGLRERILRGLRREQDTPEIAPASGGVGGGHPPEEPPQGGERSVPSVSGLTAEEVELFLSHGYTAEELQGAATQLGSEGFRQEADIRLRQMRGEQTEEVGQSEEEMAAQREERIRQLQGERESLEGMPADTPEQGRLRELRQIRIDEELRSLSGEGSGGNGGSSGGVEGPSTPPEENRNRLEFEASPERGREIAEGIIRWEALIKAGKIELVDWNALDQLYLDQEIHIEALRIVSLRLQPFEGGDQLQEPIAEVKKVDLDRFKDLSGNDFRPLEEWLDEYRRGAISDRDKFINEVNIYFDEAKKVGLIKDLDVVLSAAYNKDVLGGIRRKLTLADVMIGNPRVGIEGVEQKIQAELTALTLVFNDRFWEDPGIASLNGVGELYAQFARGRFAAAINNRDPEGLTQRPYLIDNEFRLGSGEIEDASEETFWRLQHGWYIEIYAETEKEFLIAAESYISRLEAITAAPEKIFEEATRFIDVMSKSDGAKKLSSEFINNLTLAIEARVGVYGADTSNELYQAENYKKFMDFINKDGRGPDRWLALARLFDGKVAATLWALDKDPRWEILFSLFGSRGQLAKASQAMRNSVGTQGLYAQVRDVLIEEMMGVSIKDKRNVPAELTKWGSDKVFTSMFDGLYQYGKVPKDRFQGDANIRVYEQYKDTPDRELTTDQRRVRRLGRIQLELWDIRSQIRSGQLVLPKGQTEIDAIKNPAERNFYRKELESTKKAFDIAFQMYGSLGEKSKRAGGVFKTAFKEDSEGKKYRYFVPVHYAEKFIQMGETLIKMKYANRSAEERKQAVARAREKNIAEFKRNGYEAKLQDEDGNQLTLKRPNEDTGEVEEVDVDFYIATHHSYGDWTGHTYWSYQEEDRHLILEASTFAQAKKIRAGELRPEDADPWAIQLLILDPTLRRVRRFEDNFEERERKLTMAAVEDSYQSHWRISRELHEKFFPKYGTPTEEIGMYYGLQDYGGFRKIIENVRTRFGEDPERYTRRGRRLIPYIHLPAAALSEYLGQGSVGAFGVIRMLGAPIYRMCGTLALDKFSAQSEIAGKMHAALTIADRDNEGNLIEPLLLKLTNESDELQEYYLSLPRDPSKWTPENQHKFRVGVRKSFGRLERYEKLFVSMETVIRNASGALWLEDVNILTDNGKLDGIVEAELDSLPDIARDAMTRDDLIRHISQANAIGKKYESEYNRLFNTGNDKEAGIDEGKDSVYTGSGRHSARIFHDNFFEIFLDEGKRGGLDLYPDERFIYSHLRDKVIFYDPNTTYGRQLSEKDIIDWLFEKFVPT